MVRTVRSTFIGLAFLFVAALGARAEDASPPAAGPKPPSGVPASDPPFQVGVESAGLPKDLESLLALAMRGNPEILVAEAKVAQAEAEAHAARLRVSLAVLETRAQQVEAIERRAAAEKRLGAIEERVAAGMVSQEEADRAREAFAEAKAAVAEGEARLRYLCGASATQPRLRFSVDTALSSWRELVLRQLALPRPDPTAGPAAPSQGASPAGNAVPDVLDRAFRIPTFDGRVMTLRVALDDIRRATGILLLVDRRAYDADDLEALLKSTLSLDIRQEMPLQALLDAVADSLDRPVLFAPRQYGAMLTER